MTQELLRDICTRLPYGIYVKENRESLDPGPVLYTHLYHPHIENCKPYLRPMSSMTDDEKKTLEDITDVYFGKAFDKQIEESIEGTSKDGSRLLEYMACAKVTEYLDSIRVDHSGLIGKGLALPAPEGMY